LGVGAKDHDANGHGADLWGLFLEFVYPRVQI
jgi:hypothetical protein